eukprot:tig00000093_g3570.t1
MAGTTAAVHTASEQAKGSIVRGASSVPYAADTRVYGDERELFKPRESRAEFAAILEQAGTLPPSQGAGGPTRSPLRSELVTGSALGRSAALPLIRKTVRVFFSSTFSDMEQERNDLISDVYPFLRLVARRYGLEFQAVDMRWGVSDESVDDHNVVQICSEEVARCVGESAGPAFIVLGGQKYGYRPIPSNIPVEEFAAVRRHLADLPGADPASLRLLEKWYQLDENALPPAYHLTPISRHFPDYVHTEDREAKKRADAAWGAECAALTSLLRSAAAAVPDPERRRLYTVPSTPPVPPSPPTPTFAQVSVTEMEIEGALEALAKAGALDKFYVVEREIGGLAACAAAGGPHGKAIPRFIDCAAAPTPPAHGRAGPHAPGPAPSAAAAPAAYAVDKKAQQLLAALSGRVRAAAPAAQRARLSTAWGQPLPAPYVRAFSDAVLEHTRTAREMARQCHGRAALKEAVVSYLESTGAEGAPPLALVGGSGTGKSSLLGAAWAEVSRRARQRGGPGPVIVGRFCGTTPLSSDAASLMRSIVEQCAEAYEAEASELVNSLEIRDVAAAFEPALAWGTPQRPLYILIDAVDQLSDAGNGRKLGWLPTRLPPHTRLVLSVIPGEAGGGAFESFQDFVGAGGPASGARSIVHVPAFDRATAEGALDAWYQEAKRTLRPAQRAEVLRAFAGCPTPLYLRMCWEEAMEWRSWEPPERAVIQAGDVPGLVEREMYRLENKYGSGIVSGALGYITLADKGITISELEDVLSCDDAVLDGLFVWWTPPVRRVPPSLLLRIRSDVGHFLTERGSGDASGASVLGWFHRQFREAAERRYLYHEQRVREMHEILAAYFGDRYSAGKALRAAEAAERGGPVNRHVAAQPLMLGPGLANVRRLQMQPAHLLAAGQLEELLACCADPRFLEAAAAGRCLGGLLAVVEAARRASRSAGNDALRAGFFDLETFLGRHFQQFTLNCPGPSFVLQQAANERADSVVARRAAAHLAEAKIPWIRRLNKSAARDNCIFAIEFKYGAGEKKPHGGVDVWADSHVVVASHESRMVVCFDMLGNERWSTRLAQAPLGAVRVSNDGTRVAVALADFGRLAVLSMKQGKVLAEMDAGGLHARSSTSLELICWSADSRRFATAAGDVVLWDAVTYRPIKVAVPAAAFPADAGSGSIRPHTRFGTHGRTSFGFGSTARPGGAGIFFDVSAAADRADREGSGGGGGVDRAYDGERFDMLLAESHCGRFRVVGKVFAIGARHTVKMLFAVSNEGNRVLAYVGLGAHDQQCAIEAVAGSPEVARVIVCRDIKTAVPEAYEVNPERLGSEVEKTRHGTLLYKLGGESNEVCDKAREEAWEYACRVGRRWARYMGVLKGHVSDIWAGRFVEGGEKFLSYDCRELRLWDLALLEEDDEKKDMEAGDAIGFFQFNEYLFAQLTAAAPFFAPAAAKLKASAAAAPDPGLNLDLEPLVASLRAEGVLSVVRRPAGGELKANSSSYQGPQIFEGGSNTRRSGLAALVGTAKLDATYFIAACAIDITGAKVVPVDEEEVGEVYVRAGLAYWFWPMWPCYQTAVAASPGVGPLCVISDFLEAFLGCEDGSVHACILMKGQHIQKISRRASWFHAGPVVAIATSASDPRAAGAASHIHAASLSLDGTLILATLPAAPAVGCSAALVDRFPLAAGAPAPSLVALAEAAGPAPPPLAVACGCDVLLYTPAARGGFEKRLLRSHGGTVRAVAFTAGGRIVSLAEDGSARVWEAVTGRLVYKLGFWKTDAWSAAAFDGVSRSGANAVRVGTKCLQVDIFDIVSLDSVAEPQDGEAPPPPILSGVDASAKSLNLRARAPPPPDPKPPPPPPSGIPAPSCPH